MKAFSERKNTKITDNNQFKIAYHSFTDPIRKSATTLNEPDDVLVIRNFFTFYQKVGSLHVRVRRDADEQVS